MRAADRAWLALGAGVLAYDLLSPDGETLSEGIDRYLARRPMLTRMAVLAVSRHLLNQLDPDPIHIVFTGLRRLRGRPISVVVVNE